MTSATDSRKRPAAKPAQPGEEFLHRWSRRKHAARERVPEVLAPEPPAAPAKVLTDADMPPIESLNEKSDYSMFMSPGVSEDLRRQALRKLFSSLPGLNQPEALNSEFYDCHGYEPLGNVITHEMREEMEREAAKAKQEATKRALREKTQLIEEVEGESHSTVRREIVESQASVQPDAHPATDLDKAVGANSRHSRHLRKRGKRQRSRA